MSEENIGNITKSNSNFEPNFVDHHLLPFLPFYLPYYHLFRHKF